MRVSVVGAAGYAGAELVRLLLGHPEIEIDALTSETFAGQLISEVYGELRCDIRLRSLRIDEIESPLVFTALPHGKSAEVVGQLREQGCKVIDFSADFRLKSIATYERWYGPHPREDLIETAVYGLPELYRKDIAAADLVANPGCYPTAAILALAPVVEGKLPEGSVVVDAKSGVSGAGRKLSMGTHFPQINENMLAYAVAGHRHLPEIEEQLAIMQGSAMNVQFVPHLIPVNRGILATCYLRLEQEISTDNLRQVYARFYQEEYFVQVLAAGKFPEVKAVSYSNRCLVGVHVNPGGRAIIVSVIDNLGKGAAGQAVQNMNLMCGFPESAGLQ